MTFKYIMRQTNCLIQRGEKLHTPKKKKKKKSLWLLGCNFTYNYFEAKSKKKIDCIFLLTVR